LTKYLCKEGKFISKTINSDLILLRASNVGPIGLICCFGLLLFLIAASIVLALIPVYLPSHTSGLQSASTRKFLINF
jgi:hypothetical protein